MIVIEYDPEKGNLISDCDCLKLPNSLIGEENIHWNYSNELIIHSVIDAMLDGLICNEKLIIRYENKDYKVDELGFIIERPELTRTKLSQILSSKRLKKLNDN